MHKQGNEHYKWKPNGTRIQTKAGYIKVKLPEHPNSHMGWVYEHVAVMSKSIGRKLNKNESVHHKNGIKWDNRLQNLQLWVKVSQQDNL